MNLPCIIPYIVLLTNPRFRNIWQSEEVWTSSIDITWLQWKPHVRTIWNACNPVSCFSLLASVLRSNNLVARYSIFLTTKIKKKKKVVNPSTVKRCLHVLLLIVIECDSLLRQSVRQVFRSCQLSSRLAALLLFQLFK
jgi:hypothetical protein